MRKQIGDRIDANTDMVAQNRFNDQKWYELSVAKSVVQVIGSVCFQEALPRPPMAETGAQSGIISASSPTPSRQGGHWPSFDGRQFPAHSGPPSPCQMQHRSNRIAAIRHHTVFLMDQCRHNGQGCSQLDERPVN